MALDSTVSLTLNPTEDRMNARTILAKHTIRLTPTHNRDGLFLRCWRLLSDGTVERTNSRSRFQPYRDCETLPPAIRAAAAAAGIRIKPGRPGRRRHGS
jgi:hypothetical protein